MSTLAVRRSYSSMSDDQLDNEHRAQKRLYEAIGDFREAIEMVNRNSVCVSIPMKVFDDFLHDEMPKISSWDRKIAEARHV